MKRDIFKSGFVSIVGRPNVGKSTLVNALIDNELSISSQHPHTTTRQIRAIDNSDDYQIIYVDTPGIHKPKNETGQAMNDEAYDALSGVDIVVAVFDASQPFGKGDRFLAEELSKIQNLFVVLNKCDVFEDVGAIANKAKELSEIVPHAKEFFVVSAFTKKNVQILKKSILESLEPGEAYFDNDISIDMSDSELVSDVYREQLIRQLYQELPQKVKVSAEKIESDRALGFEVKVYVESNSQKAIVLGQSGSMIEKVGTLARKKLESIFGKPVFLRVNVVLRAQK